MEASELSLHPASTRYFQLYHVCILGKMLLWIAFTEGIVGIWDSYEKFTETFNPQNIGNNETSLLKVVAVLGAVVGFGGGYKSAGIGGAAVGACIGAFIAFFCAGAVLGLARQVIYHLLLFLPFIIVIGAVVLLWGVKF